MNYRKDIEKLIEYIDSNITNELVIDELCNYTGYTKYHLSRVFKKEKSKSLMQYITERRLSLSTIDLYKGYKHIDIAQKYGFETASGYSKAFKKVYGISPTQYKEKFNFYVDYIDIDNIEKYSSEPKFQILDSFTVAGYGIKTNQEEVHSRKDVSSFWKNYNGINIEEQLYKKLNPKKHIEIGLSTTINNQNYYLLGVIVDELSNIEYDMKVVNIPKAEYAIFKTYPVNTLDDQEQKNFSEVIIGTWKYIFEEWFIVNDYIYDDEKIDFEYYDEYSHHRKDTYMHIYIPIKRRKK